MPPLQRNHTHHTTTTVDTVTATGTTHPAPLTDRQRRVLFAIGALDLVWRGGQLYDEFGDEPLELADLAEAHELERLGLAHVGDRTRPTPTEAGRALMHRIVPDRAPWWVIARAHVRQLLHRDWKPSPTPGRVS